MDHPADRETEIGGQRRDFAPTAWTQVMAARDAEKSLAGPAWDGLLHAYWKPIYFQIRREGHDVEDAKDLTQQFFATLIERDALRTVDAAKGRFRSFIRACLQNFLRDEYDRRKAAKRRPDFDALQAEAQFKSEQDFERDWALAVMERAFVALKEQAPREARVVEAQRAGEKKLTDLAREFGISEANVKVLAHRGRNRLRELILRELRATVLKDGDKKEELNDLFRSWTSPPFQHTVFLSPPCFAVSFTIVVQTATSREADE